MAVNDPVFLRYRACQYDGTNSTEVMSVLNSVANLWLFDSADSEQMIFTDLYSTPFVLETTDWVAVEPMNGFINKYTNANFPTYFAVGPEVAGLVNQTPTDAIGIASVPSLGASAQTTVEVTLNKTYADTSYDAVASIIGGTQLLGNLNIQSVTNATASRVDVVVRNNGIITLAGAQVLVVTTA